MRKHMFLIAITAILAISAVAPLNAAVWQQEQQQEQQTIEGNLKAVNLEESKIVVTQEDETEITLVVTGDTVVRGPSGEATTLDSLTGMEGQSLTARFVQMDEQNVALAIQLVA